MRFGFLYFVSFFWCIYIKVQTFTHQINQKFLCIFTTVWKKLKSSHTHICTAYSQYPITRLIKANIFWKKVYILGKQIYIYRAIAEKKYTHTKLKTYEHINGVPNFFFISSVCFLEPKIAIKSYRNNILKAIKQPSPKEHVVLPWFIFENGSHQLQLCHWRYTNADLKISFYVCVYIKTILWKFCILYPENSRVICSWSLQIPSKVG